MVFTKDSSIEENAIIKVRRSFLCSLLYVLAAWLPDLLLLHSVKEGFGVVPLRICLLQNGLLPLIHRIEDPCLLFLLFHLHLLRPHWLGEDGLELVGIGLAVFPGPKLEPRRSCDESSVFEEGARVLGVLVALVPERSDCQVIPLLLEAQDPRLRLHSRLHFILVLPALVGIIKGLDPYIYSLLPFGPISLLVYLPPSICAFSFRLRSGCSGRTRGFFPRKSISLRYEVYSSGYIRTTGLNCCSVVSVGLKVLTPSGCESELDIRTWFSSFSGRMCTFPPEKRCGWLPFHSGGYIIILIDYSSA